MTYTAGWKMAIWKNKIRCSRCGRGVRSGYIHVHDRPEHPSRTLCLRCHGEIMDTPIPAGFMDTSEDAPTVSVEPRDVP